MAADVLGPALQNLLSVPILFFALGVLAAALRSDLEIPAAMGKGLSLYLMAAIGFKGGVELARSAWGVEMGLVALAGVALSLLMPVVAFRILRSVLRLDVANAAGVAATYGSVSVVTFVTASTSALVIGWLTGEAGVSAVGGVLIAPFQGILALFLLDMGLLVVRRLRETRAMRWGLVAFGLAMPLVGAAVGLALAAALGLSAPDGFLLAVLAGSASYIAVPAALRVALPEANPSIYVTLSLAVTFPFNIVLGIPLYYAAARLVLGG